MMRMMHRAALYRAGTLLAGMALAAGSALSGSSAPAGAATTGPAMPMDFPGGQSTGVLWEAATGECLVAQGPGRPTSGDPVVLAPCDGTSSQVWWFIPVGTKRFIQGTSFHVDHAAYRIVNIASALCLDTDPSGGITNGSPLRVTTCSGGSVTGSTQWWGPFNDVRNQGQNLLANVWASNFRDDLMVIQGPDAGDGPARMFPEDASPPPLSMEFFDNRVS